MLRANIHPKEIDLIQSYLSDKKHRIECTPEMLASFIGAWFGQTKIRKMHNNFNDYFSHRGESWIKELMV